jgi:thiol-disulfide isomerase/thioredoxin
MIKRLLFFCALVMVITIVNGQKVARWKMEDVVKSFSADNDTVYVVNFWATFCKPCNEEIPDFIRLTNKYKTQKVKLLLVSLDLPSYVPVRLPEFIKKNKYKTNHVWLNETDADRFCPMIDEKWSGAIPATLIVNNKTGYRKFFDDQISAADFEAALKAAMGGSVINKYVAPMNDAEVIKESAGDIPHVNEYLTFKSNDSSVFVVSGGKVSMVAKIDHMKVVIIEKDNIFYTYSNLGSTLIKKGEEVKADQLIGYAAYDLDKYKPSIDFYISTSEKNIMLTKEDFINRSDKKQTDHSIDGPTRVRMPVKF